jgi:hypothetical protein
MFSPNLCPYFPAKRLQGSLVGIQQYPLLHGGVIGNKDLLHLSNNTLHPRGGLIYLKIDPRDKTECSKKVMYSNFEKEKNSQLWNTTLVHHPSMLGLGVYTRVKGSKALFFAPLSSSIKCSIKNSTKLK